MDVKQSYGDGRKARQAAWAAVGLWSVLPVAAWAAEPSPGDTFRDCPECPEMVVVPSGSFRMGSPESEEGRDRDEDQLYGEVRIGYRFSVGVYEVTRGEFARFVSETGRSMGDSCRGRMVEVLVWEKHSWKSPGYGQTDEHPVVCVNWHDAEAYVQWLSNKTGKEYRLLSEAEWEYVARAGTVMAWYWGESETGQCEYANGLDREAKRHDKRSDAADCDDGYSRTAPVGSFQANGFGLHDVLGNVSEWVEDCWTYSYRYGAPMDGSAWVSGNCGQRVLRGGSWYSVPSHLRSANRDSQSTDVQSYYRGFRVARTLTP